MPDVITPPDPIPSTPEPVRPSLPQPRPAPPSPSRPPPTNLPLSLPNISHPIPTATRTPHQLTVPIITTLRTAHSPPSSPAHRKERKSKRKRTEGELTDRQIRHIQPRERKLLVRRGLRPRQEVGDAGCGRDGGLDGVDEEVEGYEGGIWIFPGDRSAGEARTGDRAFLSLCLSFGASRVRLLRKKGERKPGMSSQKDGGQARGLTRIAQ